MLFPSQGTWKEQLKQKFRIGRRGTKSLDTADDKENEDPQSNEDAAATKVVQKRRLSYGGK